MATRKQRLRDLKYESIIKRLEVIYDLSKRDYSLGDDIDLAEFKVRFADIDSLYEEFTSLHFEIQLDEGEDLDTTQHGEKFMMYDKMYYEIRRRYSEVFSSNSDNVKPIVSTGGDFKSNISLPRLHLPTFSGKIEEYISFMELFDSMVGRDRSLSDTEKLFYLFGSVTGEAKSLIQHLCITEKNYSVAIELLNNRYRNKRLLVDKLMYNLFNFGQVHKILNSLKPFLNSLLENTKALERLELPVAEWSYVLFYLNLQKLDLSLRKHFEERFVDRELPTFENLLKFLEDEVRILETSSIAPSTGGSRVIPNATRAHASVAGVHDTCGACKGTPAHPLTKCRTFISWSPVLRKNYVVDNGLCFRCFRQHRIANCNSTYKCTKCGSSKHSVFLHFELPRDNNTVRPPAPQQERAEVSSAASSQQVQVSSHAARGGDNGGGRPVVLLSTAMLRVRDSSGEYHSARALLDTGSQTTFITDDCVRRLGLRRFRYDIDILGLSGASVGNCKGAVTLNIVPSSCDGPELWTRAVILNKITHKLPSFDLPADLADRLNQFNLADRLFYKSGDIDILIGADLLGNIILGGVFKVDVDLPMVFNTIFGYVVMGPVSCSSPGSNMFGFAQCFLNTDQILEKFWQVEDIPNNIAPTKELECEKIFAETHSRNESGGFVVRLPFLSVRLELGDSAKMAMKRFLALEKRLLSNVVMRNKYISFMREYAEMGHMVPLDISEQKLEMGKHCVIPHHGIFKANSDKIRVVFDGNCRTSSGVSLNDCLHAGPNLQHDLMEVICRFRLFPVVFSTDIRMMFRFIFVHDEDTIYQLIYWRDSPDEPIRLYKLNRVTYGLKSSPFLAVRVLRQLADDEEERFPLAAKLLRDSAFMDDICCGAHSVTDALKLKDELIGLLKSAGFELSKWKSNCNEILQNIESADQERPRVFDNADGPEFHKILGIQWDPKLDIFSYNLKMGDNSNRTKRSILSTLARTFDPLGWISPVILQGKLIMQRLWLLNLSWDDEPPAEVVSEWNSIFADLSRIGDVRLERFALTNTKRGSLHGFSDASDRAYSAVVYLRAIDDYGNTKVTLIMAKSRVAPVKTKLTTPKLELCGAALLMRLLKYVHEAIKNEVFIEDIVGWTDSSIVLSWLRLPPHVLQPFEGNRVSQIVACELPIAWRHVPSKTNPADVGSRGCRTSELIVHPLWWEPGWLKCADDTWPKNIVKGVKDLPGLRKTTTNTLLAETDKFNSIFTKFSSLSKLQVVVGYCLRFIFNIRQKDSSKKLVGVLTALERRAALDCLVRMAQGESYSNDVDKLRKNLPVQNSLRRLMPFLDDCNLLRVGGRLEFAAGLPEGARHPLLLPKYHPLTNLIVDHFHVVYCHVGPSALQAILQNRFWIVSARQVIRSRIFKCIFCFRVKARPSDPIMSALPSDRVNANGVFHTVQTDFAGPFLTRESRLRKSRQFKSYLCVFVCSATKSVHLEVVGDLSTEAFLAAFTRFTSRRGLPSVIRSDCGTNYIGTKRNLDDVQNYLSKRDIQDGLSAEVSKRGVVWLFNVPGGPHFGGLFEAAVKLAKTLLKRVIGERILTFEELSTVFARVEAVLNSRPLYALSQDPREFDVLTPAHFLIGRPLLSVPEFDFADSADNRLSRYQLLRAMAQRFWRRWSEQYLHTLQMRHKWTSDCDPPKIGELVLIKEDNVGPLKWRLGRIQELMPGKDGVIRVVKLGTSSGTLLRPVVKICRLPID